MKSTKDKIPRDKVPEFLNKVKEYSNGKLEMYINDTGTCLYIKYCIEYKGRIWYLPNTERIKCSWQVYLHNVFNLIRSVRNSIHQDKYKLPENISKQLLTDNELETLLKKLLNEYYENIK